MDLNLLIPLVEKINGSTFASLDATTETKPGILHKVEGQRVIIFRTNGKSGYEAKVKRQLAEAGIDPDTFKVGPLPWGTRLGNLPIIQNQSYFYLQTIELTPGRTSYHMKFTGSELGPHQIAAFGIRKRPEPIGGVKMRTYRIDNIDRITLMGETLSETSTATKPSRSILTIAKK